MMSVLKVLVELVAMSVLCNIYWTVKEICMYVVTCEYSGTFENPSFKIIGGDGGKTLKNLSEKLMHG